MKTTTLLAWFFQLVIAAILLPVGWGKLLSHTQEVALFTQLGMEPHGRLLIGAIELIAGGLVLTPFAATGALLTLGVMAGAAIAHTTILGWLPLGGEYILIFLFLTVALSSCAVLYLRRAEIPFIGRTF